MKRLLITLYPYVIFAVSLFAPDSLLPNGKAIEATATDKQNRVNIEVDWIKINEETKRRITNVRITKSTSVVVHSKNFNFLNYTLEYTVEEEIIETYQSLERLFAQALGLGSMLGNLLTSQTPTELALFQTSPLAVWHLRIDEIGSQLDDFLGSFEGRYAVNWTAGRDSVMLDSMLKKVDEHEIELDSLRTEAREEAQEKYRYVSIYFSVRELHEALKERLNALESRASLCKNGQRRNINKKKAGTVVTITMTPKDINRNEAGQGQSFEYFVHSEFPVTFHAGFGVSGLNEIDFEKVRTVSGADLFNKVSDEEYTTDLTAYLSYQLKSWGDKSQEGFFFTLGTDFAQPLDKLYGGFSYKLQNRIFVTVGVITALEEEGLNSVVDRLGEELEAQELFGTINAARKFNIFLGISFGVF